MTRVYPILRLLLCWLLLCRLPCSASAQSIIIEGQVRDSLGRPVDFANVYVQAEADSSAILAFAMTDPDGQYRLEIRRAPGRLLLTAGKLSFEKQSVTLFVPPGREETTIRQDILLNSKTYSFKEVIVHTESPPVVIRKDTIIFKADAFTDGNEEVVEDLLRRLPGVEVTETGVISVNGKTIEKVLVERDDLFGKGYQLVTQNMSAELVDKVEILDHYSGNPLLKGIEDSDKVAVNLLLKEDRKSTLFGNAQLGYSPPDFYENRSNLISFNRKTKYYLLGNANNIGKNPAEDFLFKENGTLFEEDPLGADATALPLINLTQQQPDLGRARYHQNNAEFASLNAVYRPRESLKIKGLAFLDFDEFRLRENSRWQYTVENIDIREDKNLRNAGRAFSFKLDGIYQPDDKTRLVYAGSRFQRKNQTRRQLISNQRKLAEQLNEEAIINQHRLTITRKLDNQRVLQVFARRLTDEKPQKYLVDNFFSDPSFFPGQYESTIAQQGNRHRLNFSGLLGQYMQNIDDNILDIRFAYTHTAERLSGELHFSDPDGSLRSAGDNFANEASLRLTDLFTSLKYQQQLFPTLALGGTLEMHYIHARSKNGLSDSAHSADATVTTGLHPLPKVRINWEPNDKNQLLLAYSRGLRNTSLPDIYKNYILDDYRNLTAGAGQFHSLTSQYLLLNYRYGGWSKQFLINASLNVIRDDRYLSSRYRIYPDINTSSKIVLKDRHLTSLNISVDRFLDALAGNLKLKAGLSGNAFENILNDSMLRTIRSNTLSFGGEWRSAFEGRFNFHLGTNWELTFVRRPAFQRNGTNFSFLDLLFDLSEQLSLRVKQDLYYFPNLPDTRQLFYFADVDLRFTPKKNALTLKLTGRNLFNTGAFSTLEINDVRSFSNRIALFSRYVLLKINFRF